MNLWLAVFLGGGVGSLVRFSISQLFLRFELKGQFPWATLTTNLLATAFLAWLALRYEVNLPGKEQWRALLVVGFCGGFSTLSTFSMENYQLLRDGLVGYAVVNVLLSAGVGVLLFYLMSRPS